MYILFLFGLRLQLLRLLAWYCVGEGRLVLTLLYVWQGCIAKSRVVTHLSASNDGRYVPSECCRRLSVRPHLTKPRIILYYNNKTH